MSNSEIRQELKDAFDLLDIEKKRSLGAKQLRTAISAFGLSIPQNEVDDTIKKGSDSNKRRNKF